MRYHSTIYKQKLLTFAPVVLFCLFSLGIPLRAGAQSDVADIDSTEYQIDQSDELRYLVIRPKDVSSKPKNGYKILVVLPGGDGSADFNPFIKRIYKNALGKDYLVIQLVAPKWNPSQRIVWPTVKNPTTEMKMSVEDFLAQAVKDVGKHETIDPKYVFTLSWSSGGPAAYAASLSEETPVTGSFVGMSVFKPNYLPDLAQAKGKSYYILHSPQDRICPFRMAEAARDQLSEKGANVTFVEYSGGHGWRGNVYGNMRAGIAWMEEQAKKKSAN